MGARKVSPTFPTGFLSLDLSFADSSPPRPNDLPRPAKSVLLRLLRVTSLHRGRPRPPGLLIPKDKHLQIRETLKVR